MKNRITQITYYILIISLLLVQTSQTKTCLELKCDYCCSEINGYPECVTDILKCRYSETDNKHQIYILLYTVGGVLISKKIK